VPATLEVPEAMVDFRDVGHAETFEDVEDLGWGVRGLAVIGEAPTRLSELKVICNLLISLWGATA